MTQQQAQQKISKINQINTSNNQLLATIKIGLGYTQSKLPHKLSQDLYDIYSTSIIQSNLIQQVKKLTQTITQQQYRFNNQLQQKSYELQRERKKNNQLQKKIRQVTSNNTKLYQYQNLNMRLKTQIFNQKNQYQKLKNLIHNYERQINKYKLQIDKLSKTKQAQVKKTGHKPSKMQMFQPITFKNSQYEKQMLKTKDWLRNIDQQRQSKKNQKLTQWLKRFIDSVERILQIRLKKLRQSQTSEQEIKQIYQHLPKMHIKSVFTLQSHEFPYTELLFDFEKIMQQAQQIKFENQKYQELDKTQIMNKQLVQMVIEEMRKCKSQIVQQFKACGQKREQIAIEYQTLLEYDHHVLQLVSSMTLDRLRRFQQHPNKLLNEINHEIEDIKKHRQFFQSNFSPTQPHLLTRRIQVHQNFYQQLNYLKDQQKRNQFKTEYIAELHKQEQRQKIQKQERQKDETENLSYEQKKERQYKELYKQAKQFVMKTLSERSLEQQLKQLQDTLRSKKDLNELKNFYLEQFRPQVISSHHHQQLKQQKYESEQRQKVQQNNNSRFNQPRCNNRMQQKPLCNNYSNNNKYQTSNMKRHFINNNQNHIQQQQQQQQQQSNSKRVNNIFNPNYFSNNKNQNNNNFQNNNVQNNNIVQNKKNQTQSSFSGYSAEKQWEI